MNILPSKEIKALGFGYKNEKFVLHTKKLSLSLIYFWLAILMFFGTKVSFARTMQEIVNKAFASTVLLVMEDRNGQIFSLGSGFFVKDDIVVTNLHVVEGTVSGYAKIVGQKQKYDIEGYVAIDYKMDLVLLKIDKVKAPEMILGDSSKVSIGDEIFAVGNPQGLEGTFSKGIISAIRTIDEDTLLQITAPISPGSSGGPVLNKDGNVVGISVATFKGGQNLNFAIPVSYLQQVLVDIGPVKPLSVDEKNEKKVKSILTELGGKTTDGVIGTQFRCWPSSYYFSIHNKLRNPVSNIICYVVFYDKNDELIHTDIVKYRNVIPGGLAARVEKSMQSDLFEFIKEAGWEWEKRIPHNKIEIRIVDFQLVDEEI